MAYRSCRCRIKQFGSVRIIGFSLEVRDHDNEGVTAMPSIIFAVRFFELVCFALVDS